MNHRRSICARCLRAASACICGCIETVSHVSEVLILQHPEEARHIKSSGRLLHLCLPNSQIEVGIEFEPSHLRSILERDAKCNLLLYPETNEASTSAHTQQRAHAHTAEHQEQRPLYADWRHQTPADLRLIVLDASWRQSRAMLKANPLLAGLPRMALRDTPTSRYVIRRAHKTDQLSSLEACTYALQILGPSNQQWPKLLEAFERFNQMQLAAGVHRLKRETS